MRVGIGYDIHRFVDDKPLMLGGIEIPHVKGLLGHSDGDALIHAMCDAMLGAAGLDDIGHQFPVTDNKYAGMKSVNFLKEVKKKIEEKGFSIDYIDAVLILEEPKITPFKERMKEEIANALKISKENINIKATTQEGVGAIGRGEAAAAYAVVSLKNLK